MPERSVLPDSLIDRHTRSPEAGLMSATTTLAPSAAKSIAPARPMREQAPVTIATLSSTRLRISVHTRIVQHSFSKELSVHCTTDRRAKLWLWEASKNTRADTKVSVMRSAIGILDRSITGLSLAVTSELNRTSVIRRGFDKDVRDAVPVHLRAPFPVRIRNT